MLLSHFILLPVTTGCILRIPCFNSAASHPKTPISADLDIERGHPILSVLAVHYPSTLSFEYREARSFKHMYDIITVAAQGRRALSRTALQIITVRLKPNTSAVIVGNCCADNVALLRERMPL